MGRDPRPESFRGAARRLRAAVGDHPIYLDALPASARRLAAPGVVLRQLHDALRREGLLFAPVYTAGAHDQAAGIVRSTVLDGRGLCVRYKALELVPGAEDTAVFLRAELDHVEMRPEDVDLLIDFGWIDPDMSLTGDDVDEIVARALAGGAWRTITVGGTSVPRSLGRIQEHSLGVIAREEWRIWNGLGRPLEIGYADYGIQHPRAPYTGRGAMRANVRYTTSTGTVVARGEGELFKLPAVVRASQYQELCGWLTARDEFGGRDCCWGDGVIEDVADGAIAPGTQNMWRGAGTSHHLAVVARSLAALEDRMTTRAAPRAAGRTRRLRPEVVREPARRA